MHWDWQVREFVVSAAQIFARTPPAFLDQFQQTEPEQDFGCATDAIFRPRQYLFPSHRAGGNGEGLAAPITCGVLKLKLAVKRPGESAVFRMLG